VAGTSGPGHPRLKPGWLGEGAKGRRPLPPQTPNPNPIWVDEMPEKLSLIDLGKVSKPISKLIEAVSQGIGTLYEPTRIRRRARAQADAALIKAEADIKKKELLQRAVNRFAFQEISRQENIENIIEIAAASLPETVSEEPVDKDWISRFFDECKDVSNDELQQIWGRLLACEVAKPRSCSRKTLATLKELSQEDAELFTEFCSYIWIRIGDFFDMKDLKYYEPYYFMPIDPIDLGRFLEMCNLTYGECLHLENLGLIHCKKDISFNLCIHDILIYSNLYHSMSLDCKNYNSYIGRDDWGGIACFVLTQAGIELLSVAKVEANWDYYYDSCKFFSVYHDVYFSCPIDKNIKLKY